MAGNWTPPVFPTRRPNIGGAVRTHLAWMAEAQLAREIQSRVGHDLQWSRVNGAFVGFLAGLAIAFAPIPAAGVKALISNQKYLSLRFANLFDKLAGSEYVRGDGVELIERIQV